MKKKNSILFPYIMLGYCSLSFTSGRLHIPIPDGNTIINESGISIRTRVNLPTGFIRIPVQSGSFGEYLRNLPLKPHGTPVLLYNGKKKVDQSVHAAVIDMEIGKKDLQQCADAVMRLRAEYWFQKKEYDSIHFNFTSGHRCDYVRWAEGYRPVVKGNQVSYVKIKAKDYSYSNFRLYLDVVFTYAGSLSLSKELKPVTNIDSILPGDVFIIGGSPGHAVTVIDVAVNQITGKKIFLLAQSYMPAQETHILRNPANEDLSPWYSVDFGEALDTPEWIFKRNELMRFR